MLGLLTNRWLMGGIVVLALLLGAYLKGMGHGKDIIQNRWDAEKVVQERMVQEANEKAREAERTLQKKADIIAKEKQSELENLRRKHASIVAGLRDRPRRDPPGLGRHGRDTHYPSITHRSHDGKDLLSDQESSIYIHTKDTMPFF